MQSIVHVLENPLYFTGLRQQTNLPEHVWTVDKDRVQFPEAEFTSIADAILAASPGDTILVFPDTYEESLAISKPLNIYGNGAFVNPDPAGRTGGESILSHRFPVSITASMVSFMGFEIKDFYNGISIPESGFLEPDFSLSNITLSYNWLHGEDVWTGIGAQGGTLQSYEISHSIIDINHTSTEAPAYALTCISFSRHTTAKPIYRNIVIRSNILRNRSGQYDLFAGASPDQYIIDECTIECNHFLNVENPTPVDGASFNIGNIQNGRFESNVVEDAPGSIGLVNGTIQGNSFLHGGGLKLWGTEYGFTRPSQNILIQNNEFSNEKYGNGLHLRPGVLADTITDHYNFYADSGITPDSLLDVSKGIVIYNETTLTHNATLNWWSSPEGPSSASGKIKGAVVSSPCITHLTPICDCDRHCRLCWPLSTFRRKCPGFYPRVITGISYIGDTCFEIHECVTLDYLITSTGGSGKGLPVDITVCGRHYRLCTSVGGSVTLKIGCLCCGTHTITASSGDKEIQTSIHVQCKPCP